MATQHVKDARELIVFFEQRGLAHYIDLFLRSGFTLANLHLVTADDLTRMRITNRKERDCVMGAVEARQAERQLPPEAQRARRTKRALDRSRLLSASRAHRSTAGAGESDGDGGPGASSGGVHMETLADGTVTMTMDGMNHTGFDAFTATSMTANECAREAELFLQHQNIARPWPRPGSKMAQSLNLTNAAPKSHDAMYSIDLSGDAHLVHPPCHHTAGYQAKFCKICVDFVQEGMQGQWQFQALETVVVGDGVTEQVPCWKAFQQAESLKIEFAHKRKEPGVKIRSKPIDFAAMRWGKRPIRRVNRDTVPFPTLKRRDVVSLPTMPELPQQEIAAEIFDLTRLLVSDTEERKSRIRIEQEEAMELMDVLARIQAIMEDFFSQQRAQLEREEATARALIEGPEYEAALDRLFDFEEASVREVAVKQMANESAIIWARQNALLEELERQVREHIESEEAATRENLLKLVNMLNTQCAEMIARAKERVPIKHDGKLRCPICRKVNCEFHKQPWRNHWRHRGGALDLQARVDAFATLSQLMARASEREYEECVANMRADKSERKASRRLRQYLGLGEKTGDASMLSPQKIAGPLGSGAAATQPGAPSPGIETPVRATNRPRADAATMDPSLHFTSSPAASPIAATGCSGELREDHGPSRGDSVLLPPRPQSAAPGRPSSACSDHRSRPASASGFRSTVAAAVAPRRSASPRPFCSTVGNSSHVTPETVTRLSKCSISARR